MAVETAESRRYYFDFLRVLAVFAVIFLHVTVRTCLTTDIYSFEWNVSNFYVCISAWAVPVFVMMSGSLFLSRDIPVKKIYGKYIFRIFTAFVFWSFVYSVNYYVKTGDIMKAVGNFIIGNEHLWFLFMITGMYMLLPLTKKISESDFLIKYFLVFSFLFTFLLPEVADVISVFSERYGAFADKFIDRFHLRFVGGYTGYFLLGYLLDRTCLSKRTEYLIYAAGILGVIAGVSLSVTASVVQDRPQTLYDYLTVNTMLVSVAVFVFFKSKFNRPLKIMEVLSRYSFGVYLVHSAVIGVLLQRLSFNLSALNQAFSAITISMIVFVISLAISAVLNHIPVLKKYIV